MNTIAKGHLFAAVFSQLSIFTADAQSYQSYPGGGYKTSLVPRLSSLRWGRAWYIYYVHDVKGRHDLFVHWHTWNPAHVVWNS